VVSTQSSDWQQRARAAAGGRPISAALDPVGGNASADLLSLPAPGGSLIVYGLMAPEQIPVHDATQVHRDVTIRWLTIARWGLAPAEQRTSDLASAIAISQGLATQFDVAAKYPLSEIRAAAAHAARSGKSGTVLVRVAEVAS
jgi:NADPH:quinone reductase-like Zn-dependent oxidoreductase